MASQSPERCQLRRARDPLAHAFAPTAEEYVQFMETGEYALNHELNAIYWASHYENVRMEVRDVLDSPHLEEKRSKRELTIALFGLGLDPIGNDLDDKLLTDLQNDAKFVVVSDFSAEVIQRNIDQIRESCGLEACGFQFDITNGLSTMYRLRILELFKKCRTSSNVVTAARGMKNLKIGYIRHDLFKYLDRLEAEYDEPDPVLGNEYNQSRSLTFTIGEQDHPADIAFVPMVLAGTGAAAETQAWNTFERHLRGLKRKKKVNQVVRDMQAGIATVNTHVAASFVSRFLACNPQAIIVAPTDVDTVHERFGMRKPVPRIHIDELRDVLQKRDIVMPKRFKDWEWIDDVRHYHHVQGLRFMSRKMAEQLEIETSD
jgi:hypothetical protein